MSKIAKGIMATILIAVSLGSVFSLCKSLSFALPLIASIGGMVVFLGLWIEKEAETEGKKHPADFSKAVRFIKLKSEIGWWILMLGISLEIGVGAALTWHGVKESRQITADIARNDPHKQPIFAISAYAHVVVRPLENLFLFSSRTQGGRYPFAGYKDSGGSQERNGQNHENTNPRMMDTTRAASMAIRQMPAKQRRVRNARIPLVRKR